MDSMTQKTSANMAKMAAALKRAVIIKCITLNYIESGKYSEIPPQEVLATMAESIYSRLNIATRDLRAWFIEVAKWKSENGRTPLVALPDLEYARAKWSPSFVSVPKGDPQLPPPDDPQLASLPLAVALREEKRRALLTHII